MGKGLGSVLIFWLAAVLAIPPVHARASDRTIRQYHHTTWTAMDGAPPEYLALD